MHASDSRMIPARIRRRTHLVFLLLAVSLIVIPSAWSQTLTTIYSFSGLADGASPAAGLLPDAAGNLYGTTTAGGSAGGFGTIFKIDVAGNETVLHSFNQTDGQDPRSDLLLDSVGNLYGTTFGGGTFDDGTVFKLDPAGTFSTLFSFDPADNPGGEGPIGGLLLDTLGNLYGTTSFGGGSCFDGTIYKLNPAGSTQYLHCFSGADGYLPSAGLIRRGGSFYGVTQFGGASNAGTVFRLGSDGTLTVLHSFSPGPDASPVASLITDGQGNLYGTAQGTYTILRCKTHGGCGTVFKLDPLGNETVLYMFTGGADGAIPQGGLLRDKAGNLYGTTYKGGDTNLGTVFRINANGQFQTLHSFAGGAEGARPTGRLIRDAAGNLYGTTSVGGPANEGTVFKLVLTQ